MPNWCSNTVTITGDKEQIDKFEAFLKEKEGSDWFDFFLPTPVELTEVDSPNRDEKSAESLVEKYGASDWYEWNVSNWGTKWNCSAEDWSRDGDSISFWFDSAWSPPTGLYEYITQQDFDVEAYYLEEGMAFVGRFSDGYDDAYNYSDLESLDSIPDDIVDNWNLRERLEEQEEWDAEEELNNIIEESDSGDEENE